MAGSKSEEGLDAASSEGTDAGQEATPVSSSAGKLPEEKVPL